jgi:hypothetical protein
LRRIVGVLIFFGVVIGAAVGIESLPDGTNTASLVVRGLAGLSLGLVLIFIVRRMLGALADPPPPPPQTVDALETEVVYECPTCGTRLRLELAATAKAPRHCGEEMEPSVRAR